MDRRGRFDPPPRGYPRPRSPPPHRPFEDDYVRERRFQDNPLPPRMREPEPDFRNMRPRRPSGDFGPSGPGPVDEDDGVLYFSDCVMFPPRPGVDKPVRPRTVKPRGNKTVFIGGIHESLVRIPKRLDAILSEVFSANGGEIDSLRISGRGFCHLRFQKEESVERAMLLSGYFMEVKQGYEAPIKFRVMLDYAESQLDLEEHDTKNLIAIRLNMQPEDIPDIPQFSSFELDKLAADLKNPDSYKDSVIILRYWMNNNLNKQTSVRFFNVLQVTSTQIKRFEVEKRELTDEYDIMIDRYNKNVERLDKEFDHLLSLYEDAKKKKAWDNFSKPQRKSIENWFDVVRNAISTNETKSKKAEEAAKAARLERFAAQDLKKEADKDGDDDKTAKINELQESLNAMQKQVWDMVAKLHNKEMELQTKQQQIDSLSNGEGKDQASVPAKRKRADDGDHMSFEPKTVKIMCALSMFLSVFPKGTTIEAIESYLSKEFKITMNRGELETKLLQMSDVFSKQISMEDGKTVMKWRIHLTQNA